MDEKITPNPSEVTPMMKQYLETKEQYPDCILFYRLGDFYEMFFRDAEVVSRELELTLTGKSCGLEERAPMCGIPYHAVDSYLPRLTAKGYKVAICEQVEDPKLAKGLVKREVIRIVTPGTNMNTQTLDANRNNFLISICVLGNVIGLSACDVSTGDFYMTEVADQTKLRDEIMKYEPSEIICNGSYMISLGTGLNELRERFRIPITELDDKLFEEKSCREILKRHFRTGSLGIYGFEDFPCGLLAAGALLSYLYDTQKTSLDHISGVTTYFTGSYMLLDASTRRNLELTETLREKEKRGSLLWVLDHTRTAMGGRLLRRMLEQPLTNSEEINKRLCALDELGIRPMLRDELREYLGPIYDLERLLARISYKTANPRDLIAFRNSLRMLPHIKSVLADFDGEELTDILKNIDTLEDLTGLIEDSIVDEPPISVRDGGIIREGFSEEVDRLRVAHTSGKQWISDLEEAEKARTGIKGLKIKYNKAFGYYIEVTNSNLDLVPEDFIRRQTLTNAERFTTTQLKEYEDTIINGEEKLLALEYDLFVRIRDSIFAELVRIQRTAKAIARLDVYSNLSYVSEKNRYCRPKLNDKGVIRIKEGRHPVVEKMIGNSMFVPNDTYLDNKKSCVSIITGPNMAGKSTYMRQTALIVLMAQMGCYVPATGADIGVVDRVFTRVGASDDLASGQSTFMVEMNEVSNILRNATKDSLLILDEIGRGTSTYDGLSIAWAVVEHISNRRLLGAKTLFATHYHELTELEGRIDNVTNYCIAVHESGGDIVFLRKIIPGGADRSYGIEVAKLAGLPEMVIDRAKEIANQLSDNDIAEKMQLLSTAQSDNSPKKKTPSYDEVDMGQMSFFETVSDEDVLNELMEVEISTLTPVDALNTLYRLQNKLKNRFKLTD